MQDNRSVTVKEVLKVNAFKFPNKIGIKDLYKEYTFKQWDERSCRLANTLTGLGMKKGDRFAVLAYNCVEWMEIYGAAAKAGFICVPLMFRLSVQEMEYIINHCEVKILIVQAGFDDSDGKEFPWIVQVNNMRKKIPNVEHYISFSLENEIYEGYIPYEQAIADSSPEEPDTEIMPGDTWVIMYTGGTTGNPKGVVKSYANLCAQFYVMIYEHQIQQDDRLLIVMPFCHVNSLYHSFAVTWVGGTVVACNMKSFSPEGLLKIFSDHRITFTSLVPTHYIMMLALADEVKNNYDLAYIKKLIISSAPARRDTKLGILKMFPNSQLYEAYGSTEAGIVTVLRPEEQLNKLGSCGREVIGSDLIRFYDEQGNIITESNKIGELYSRSAMIFECYWKDPEKTASAIRNNGYFSAGDMGYKDDDGYVYLVDRKANMIISGGENIYPSEVENAVSSHPCVKDVAVIGVPHEKWGEQVCAFIVLHDGKTTSPEEITTYCRGKIAGYKTPRKIIYVKDENIPRSGTGKILHRVLREQYGKWSNHR